MRTSEMGERVLLGGGVGVSIISRSLRTGMPLSPHSASPTHLPAKPCRAIIWSSEFHSNLAFAAGDPTLHGVVVLRTNHETPWLPVLSCLQ